MLGRLFGKGVPAYLWIAIFYIVYVGVIAAPEVFGDIVGSEDAAADTTTITEKVEQVLSEQLFA
ncbi:MAG: hypothetical protein AAFQ73_08550, partial [Pseudomonadota bacterium]